MDALRIENLGCGVSAVVSDEHGFGVDALLLADFAAPRAAERCCDLGTGCGIIPLLWCRQERSAPVTGVEISRSACDQFERALRLSGLEDRVRVLNCDLRSLRGQLPAGGFDVVTMNPPYKAAGAGKVSKSRAAAMARHGLLCSLEDMCAAAAWLLRFGGRFCVCLRPERLSELLCLMSAAGIEPKRLRAVAKREGCAAWLVLVEGRRGGRPGMTVEAQFNVYSTDSEYSQQMRRVYACYESERENNIFQKQEGNA